MCESGSWWNFLWWGGYNSKIDIYQRASKHVLRYRTSVFKKMEKVKQL